MSLVKDIERTTFLPWLTGVEWQATQTRKLNMKLGDLVKDKVTGFKGIATGVAEYITGCKQWLVTARKVKPDGSSLSEWLDEIRLEVLPGRGIELPATGNPGGPPAGPKSTVKAPPR